MLIFLRWWYNSSQYTIWCSLLIECDTIFHCYLMCDLYRCVSHMTHANFMRLDYLSIYLSDKIFCSHKHSHRLIERSQVHCHWLVQRQEVIQWDKIWSQCFKNELIQIIIQFCRSHRQCLEIWMIQFIYHVDYCSCFRVISIRLNWEINRESRLLWDRFECSKHLELDVQLWIFWLRSWFYQLLLLVY